MALLSNTGIRAGASQPVVSTDPVTGRSLRFNDADTAYLSKTFSSAGNRKTWTISFWLKNANPTSDMGLLGARLDTNNRDNIYFGGSGVVQQLFLNMKTSSSWHVDKSTNMQFRDSSAWQHILIHWNTPHGTASERAKVYVNGELVTWGGGYSVTDPGQNEDSIWNANCIHYIGAMPTNAGGIDSNYLTGYLADFHFIDGSALEPDSFTETDGTTGQLIPKEYTGSYGSNGFYLKFDDNSGTSSTTLGKDSSGNSNNWTCNNFSVSAGVDNDSFVDFPALSGTDTGDGGEVFGNYCTFNPLITGPTYGDGNLYIQGDGDDGYYNVIAAGTILLPTTGKYMFEFTSENTDGTGSPGRRDSIGIFDTSKPNNTYLSNVANSLCFFSFNGTVYNNLTAVQSGLALWDSGDVAHCAIDCATGKVWFGVNGTWTGDPAAGTGQADTLTNNGHLAFAHGNVHNVTNSGFTSKGYVNFGQRDWAYNAPTGFKALCTQNLPDPAIAKPSDHFNTSIWTGHGNKISTGFKPGLVWIKRRDGSSYGAIVDVVRGDDQFIQSYDSDQDATDANIMDLESDGYTLKSTLSTHTYVGWSWNVGSSQAATGTWGANSKSYTRWTNATAGISIIKFVADGSTGIPGTGAIPHGLGGKPDLVISKRLDDTGHWWTGFDCLDGSFDVLRLENTNSKADESYDIYDADEVSNWGCPSTSDQIYYVFKNIAGYSEVGIYEGNNDANGTFVNCGFRPAYILTKSVDSSSSRNWQVLDFTRDSYNPASANLFPNLDNQESSYTTLDILSNGFKLRSTGLNSNAAETYFYLAFAAQPFKYTTAY